MRTIMIVVLLAFIVGCGGDSQKRDPIQVSDVPENVMKVAKEKLPDVTFDKAWRKKNGEYEISGKDKKGKVREIDITPEGKITEIDDQPVSEK
jgi:hypothetical protein